MNLDKISEDYMAVAREVFGPLQPSIENITTVMVTCLQNSGKVMFCGNGGSAADAQHFAGEFVNRFLCERPAFAGLALTTDTSVITAIGNDYSFEEVFKKQIEGIGVRGDILVSLTTSGNSANVLLAVKAAKEKGITNVVLTGGKGGQVAALAEYSLCISSTSSTPRIQEGHHLMMHLLCESVEEKMTVSRRS